MKLIVTGGAGFIGSAVVRRVLATTDWTVVNLDKLTYASSLASIGTWQNHARYRFEQVDICDKEHVRRVFAEHRPTAVLHLAAESHVDRSIDGPAEFVRTNFVGTYVLLEAAREYFDRLTGRERDEFRFHHVSTDEVFGSLGESGLFSETTAYQPNSPYSATKAGSDHLVRAWHHTFKLPTVTTNCSNNYGPYQFPEKLIPLITLNALEGRPLPIYGSGLNVRDWLFVDDHVDALLLVLKRGVLGETYNIGGLNEQTNVSVVKTICALVDELRPDAKIGPRERLIQHVNDRPGHDLRYAIDPAKVMNELGWRPKETFLTGLRKTVEWYIGAGREWCASLHASGQQRARLGVSK